jgi:hypothetical protein
MNIRIEEFISKRMSLSNPGHPFFKPSERVSGPEQLVCVISGEAQLGTSRWGTTESTPTRFRQGSILVNEGDAGSKTT